MEFICSKCGRIFDEKSVKMLPEYRDDAYGSPAYEDMPYSPCCNADKEEFTYYSNELFKCKCCGKIWNGEEVGKEKVDEDGETYLYEEYCPDCLGEVNEYVDN